MAAEIVRSYGFYALPWGFLGYSQVNNFMMRGLYPLLSVYGVTFFTVLFSAIFYVFLIDFKTSLKKEIFFKRFVIIFLFWMGIASLQFIEWTSPVHASEKLRFRVVHTAMPTDQKYQNGFQEKSKQLILALAQQTDVDATVYPELFLVHDLSLMDHEYLLKLFELINQSNNHQLIGMPDLRKDINQNVIGLFNQLIQFSPSILSSSEKSNESLESLSIKSYSKEILVPFSEYMPQNKIIRWALPYILAYPLANMKSGLYYYQDILKIKNQQLSVSLCNELAYAGLIHRHSHHASILINSSNDGWISGRFYLQQSWQIAKVRAMETQKPLLRSNNVGFSGMIDAFGKSSEMTDIHQASWNIFEVTPRKGITPAGFILNQLDEWFIK